MNSVNMIVVHAEKGIYLVNSGKVINAKCLKQSLVKWSRRQTMTWRFISHSWHISRNAEIRSIFQKI